MYKGVEKYYEIRGKFQLSEGMPKNLWVAMGMQEKEIIAEGWFNGYTVRTYEKYNYNSEKSKEEGNSEIKKIAKAFINSPKYFIKFYLKKNVSQWCEPTYESIWITQPFFSPGYREKIEKNKVLKSLYAGKLGSIYERYCDYVSIIIILYYIILYYLVCML